MNNSFYTSGVHNGKYYTKSPLSRYGSLVVKCKVTSRFGQSIEYGKSTALNVSSATTFLLSNAITQCRFGHINKFTGGWEMYYSSSDAIKGDDDIRITIINFSYAYDTFKGEYKFKKFNVKGKSYVQSWRKDSKGKYAFETRTKTKYTRTKKIQKINEEFKL